MTQAKIFILWCLHLEVSVYDAQVMQVLDGIQHLEDEAASIPFCVEAFFHNSVKQLTA